MFIVQTRNLWTLTKSSLSVDEEKLEASERQSCSSVERDDSLLDLKQLVGCNIVNWSYLLCKWRVAKYWWKAEESELSHFFSLTKSKGCSMKLLPPVSLNRKMLPSIDSLSLRFQCLFGKVWSSFRKQLLLASTSVTFPKGEPGLSYIGAPCSKLFWRKDPQDLST